MDRREFIQLGSLAAGGALLLEHARAQAEEAPHDHGAHANVNAEQPSLSKTRERPAVVAPGGQVAVTTPNGSTLPWRNVGGVKVGHLIAAPVEHEFAPGLRAQCWGYNGTTPGPTIEAIAGDRVRL